MNTVPYKLCQMTEANIAELEILLAALKNNGAKKIMAFVTHGVLSGPAFDRLRKSPISKLIVTDTIPLGKRIYLDVIARKRPGPVPRCPIALTVLPNSLKTTI